MQLDRCMVDESIKYSMYSSLQTRYTPYVKGGGRGGDGMGRGGDGMGAQS